MKKLLKLIAAISCIVPQLNGQVSFGLRVGMSPLVNPCLNQLFVNKQDPVNECLFNINRVRYSGHFGLMARAEGDHFWYMAEILYNQNSIEYSMVRNYRLTENEAPASYSMRKDFLDLPVTAGVKLGVFEIFSGFVVGRTLKVENELASMAGYSESLSSWRFGWHSGVGVSFRNLLVDVRYQQDFNNYGAGQFLHSQELILKSLPGRIMATAGFRL